MSVATLVNGVNFRLYLHLRVGPVDRSPDQRGSSNTTLETGDSLPVDVGDGDLWFCYGRTVVGGGDDPQLCNAVGGSTTTLTENAPCFVDN